jgi:hypothetical protein
MKMRIEATGLLTTIDGVPARLWIGVTAGGIPCRVYLCGLEARAEDDVERLEREMFDTLPPGKHVPQALVG